MRRRLWAKIRAESQSFVAHLAVPVRLTGQVQGERGARLVQVEHASGDWQYVAESALFEDTYCTRPAAVDAHLDSGNAHAEALALAHEVACRLQLRPGTDIGELIDALHRLAVARDRE